MKRTCLRKLCALVFGCNQENLFNSPSISQHKKLCAVGDSPLSPCIRRTLLLPCRKRATNTPGLLEKRKQRPIMSRPIREAGILSQKEFFQLFKVNTRIILQTMTQKRRITAYKIDLCDQPGFWQLSTTISRGFN